MNDPPPPRPVYTVGYGNRPVIEILAALEAVGVNCLVDIRTAPYSRFRPEFSKDALEGLLRDQGIRYVFLGRELGGRPEDPACYVDGKVEYARVRELAVYRRGLERLRKAHEQGMSLVLLCSEGRAEECHRGKLVGVSLEEMGIPVLHLDPEGGSRTQAQVMQELTGGQLSLFGAPALTSRKRYGEEDR